MAQTFIRIDLSPGARDFQPIYLERAGDGPAMVLDGRAVALWGGGAGWPGFMTVAKSEKGARFIAPTAPEIARILARHSFLNRVTQPAGSFPGQDADIVSVGSWSFVMAGPQLDESLGFRLAKALHSVEKGVQLPAQLRETTLANTLAVAPAGLLHRGVARYVREAGLDR